MSDYTICRSDSVVRIDIPTAGRVIGVDIRADSLAEAEAPSIALLAEEADRYGRHPEERARVAGLARKAFAELRA